MFVHLVSAKNIAGYGPQMDEMYRQRKKVFVHQMGWKDLDNDGPYEIDIYDSNDSYYLLVLDDVGNVSGSCRLTPTDRPNVTCDELGRYFDNNPPRQSNIWEVSRWIPGFGSGESIRRTAGLLFLAMAEFSIKNNIQTLISCSNEQVLSACALAEIPIRKMHHPISNKDGTATGIHVDVDQGLLGHLRRRFEHFMSVLIEMPQTSGPNDSLKSLQLALIEDIFSTHDEALLQNLLGIHSEVLGDYLARHDDQTAAERASINQSALLQ